MSGENIGVLAAHFKDAITRLYNYALPRKGLDATSLAYVTENNVLLWNTNNVHVGPSEPLDPISYILWADTTTDIPILKLRIEEEPDVYKYVSVSGGGGGSSGGGSSGGGGDMWTDEEYKEFIGGL